MLTAAALPRSLPGFGAVAASDAAAGAGAAGRPKSSIPAGARKMLEIPKSLMLDSSRNIDTWQ